MPTPTHQRILIDMLQRLDAGEWGPDERLPSVPQLCAHYEVSEMPVRMALSNLRALGRIYTMHGIGNFVAGPDQSDH